MPTTTARFESGAEATVSSATASPPAAWSSTRVKVRSGVSENMSRIDRGAFFVGPTIDIYQGQVVGLHNRDNDLTIHPGKEKKLTNIRSAGADEKLLLVPARRLSLEEALEFIDDDELVEVTPKSIRIRKKYLNESERKRYSALVKNARSPVKKCCRKPHGPPRVPPRSNSAPGAGRSIQPMDP